jgi:transcriptional regulator with XRE-family HTH domain
MESLIEARKRQKLSQRSLANLSNLSYKTLQLIEHKGDARLSTLKNLSSGLGYSEEVFTHYVESFFLIPKNSIYMTAQLIKQDGESSWKTHLFNFIDAFNKNPTVDFVQDAPLNNLSPKLMALIASTVETLCIKHHVKISSWIRAILPLSEPWFVANIENLKALSLLESPIHFRKRGIFVFANFLDRA